MECFRVYVIFSHPFFSCLILTRPCEVCIIIVFILQMRQKLPEIKRLAWAKITWPRSRGRVSLGRSLAQILASPTLLCLSLFESSRPHRLLPSSFLRAILMKEGVQAMSVNTGFMLITQGLPINGHTAQYNIRLTDLFVSPYSCQLLERRAFLHCHLCVLRA